MAILLTSNNDKLAKARLAKLIKELRGETTQRKFAQLLGTSYTAIQDWENQVRFPKQVNLKRIAHLRGWTEDELAHYLISPESTAVPENLLERIIAQAQHLPLAQIQDLINYLNTLLSQRQDIGTSSMKYHLNDQQKHNLHLLLRASLRNTRPTEAMVRAGLDADLFTDIFLRNDKNRIVDYDALEKFSRLCCRVVNWRTGQLPEVDCSSTYLGSVEQLFDDLINDDMAILD